MSVDWSEETPHTEAAWRQLSAEQLAAVAQADAERLELERSWRPQAKIAVAYYTVRQRLRFWEQLVTRLTTGFGPGGYNIETYFNDLESRDALDEVITRWPVLNSAGLGALLRQLDQQFVDGTQDDGGTERRRWTSRYDGDELSTRWNRVPRDIPWEH